MGESQQGDALRRSRLNRVINSRAGGVLLIWIGVALLATLGWGVGLIGVGAILLVEQVTRWRLAIDFEWFWVAAGLVAVGGRLHWADDDAKPSSPNFAGTAQAGTRVDGTAVRGPAGRQQREGGEDNLPGCGTHRHLDRPRKW